MITFNHEQYIAEAIESVISQQLRFDYELVISDDASTDKSVEIIKKYKNLYPEKIRLILHEKNIGMMPNFISALKACKGDYVALLEGDDYWIDPYKLQKQVSFLEQNPDYSICFNRVYEQLGNVKTIAPMNPWESDMTFDICDLALGNFMHTNSVVFRNHLINYFPSWFDKSPIGDYVVHMLNARKGVIKYFSDLMGVYRVSTGIWSTQAKSLQIPKVIRVLKLLEKEQFEDKVKKKLSAHKYSLLTQYCNIMLNNNDFSYLTEMESLIEGESLFVKNWMLVEYPNRIKRITNSRSFKFANILALLKNKIIK
jgi:glycosyltransferase involved in cell wall biosynthesis